MSATFAEWTHSGGSDRTVSIRTRPAFRSRFSEAIVTTLMESELGPLIIGATSKGVCLVEFSDRRMLENQLKTIKKRFDAQVVPGVNEHIEQAVAELKEYFKGNLKNFKVPLVYPGTEFQMKVWDGLRKIPYGKTTSYIELAEKVGRLSLLPESRRAELETALPMEQEPAPSGFDGTDASGVAAQRETSGGSDFTATSPHARVLPSHDVTTPSRSGGIGRRARFRV